MCYKNALDGSFCNCSFFHLPMAPETVPNNTDPCVGVVFSPKCCITNDPCLNTLT